ncbi:MAG TPA: SRPBCC family protein, partial [Bacteroidia bacterium]|nr:SRPBCC family protein [Bacteroidia bacterium]
MKKVLYVIVGLLVIYLVLCLAGPSVIKVQRSLSINASADAIKSEITDYNMFSKWSPWAEKDPAMKITIDGVPGNVGHKYAWEGNKDVGKGTMELTKIAADTVVEKLDFNGKGTSDVSFIFKPEGTATNVTWLMDMNIGFFGRGMMIFFKNKMDKMLGGDFEKGLVKLKAVVEAQPVVKTYRGYEIKEVAWPARTYYGKKSTVTFDKLSGFFADNFPKIFNDI